MKVLRRIGSVMVLMVCGVCFGESGLVTNIVIESSVEEPIEKGMPCLIVGPEGEEGEVLKESGVLSSLETTLSKKGYDIVNDPNLAAVFVKIDFAQREPAEELVEISERAPIPEVKNSVRNKNLAATTGNGRYNKTLYDTPANSNSIGEVILGPDGDVITLKSDQIDSGSPEKGFRQTTKLMMYPLELQIAAWKMGKANGQTVPENVWKVRATYKNYRPEGLDPQLRDISKVASRFIGKGLKKPKRVKR